ncbi:CidA/LrgA family protein [Psychromonas sp.]|jgi:holin-like protein|uniref:CidA/LrgA family protein n=1 Tax=Psychromonas sp. TaxID=1884585 RepID=UPI003A975BD7
MKEPSKTQDQQTNSLNSPKTQQTVETPLTDQQKVAIMVKNSLQLCAGLSIIFLFLAIAKLIIHYFNSTFPASILGMLMLFLALSLGVIKLTWIEFTGNLVLKYLALLFIPVGVGLINYFELITAHWLVIIFSLFFTTLVTLFMVGHCYQWLTKEKS